MTTLRIVIVLFITFANALPVFADEAFDFYIEAVRHSGYNPAEIATFQAELAVSTQIRLPDSIAEQFVKSTEDIIEVTMKREGKHDAEIQVKKETYGEEFKQLLSGGKADSKLIQVFIKNSAMQIGLDDTRPFVLEVNLEENESSLFSVGVGIAGNAERKPNVFQLDGRTMIRTDRLGDAWYYMGGRIQSGGVLRDLRLLLSRDDSGSIVISDTGIAAFKKNCETDERTFSLSAERVKYDGDHSASILQVHEKGRLREQFLIDSDRGYICPKVQEFHSNNGEVMFEIVSENFVLDTRSQKWFPEKVVRTSWSGVVAEKEPISSRAFVVTPGTLILNQPIPDSVFAIAVQEGTRVDDVRRDDNDKVTFFANQTGRLDLPTVEQKSLDDIEWLTPREVAQPYEPYVIKKAGWSWLQIVLMSLSVIMILLGLARLIFKKREDTA